MLLEEIPRGGPEYEQYKQRNQLRIVDEKAKAQAGLVPQRVNRYSSNPNRPNNYNGPYANPLQQQNQYANQSNFGGSMLSQIVQWQPRNLVGIFQGLSEYCTELKIPDPIINNETLQVWNQRYGGAAKRAAKSGKVNMMLCHCYPNGNLPCCNNVIVYYGFQYSKISLNAESKFELTASQRSTGINLSVGLPSGWSVGIGFNNSKGRLNQSGLDYVGITMTKAGFCVPLRVCAWTSEQSYQRQLRLASELAVEMYVLCCSDLNANFKGLRMDLRDSYKIVRGPDGLHQANAQAAAALSSIDDVTVNGYTETIHITRINRQMPHTPEEWYDQGVEVKSIYPSDRLKACFTNLFDEGYTMETIRDSYYDCADDESIERYYNELFTAMRDVRGGEKKGIINMIKRLPRH